MTQTILEQDLDYIHQCLKLHKDKFRDAEFLITGCAGFLGFYIVNYLTRYAAELGVKRIIGLDSFLLDRPAWLDALAAQHPNLLTLKTFDIARDRLDTISDSKNASYVIHMASIASPTFYRQYPLVTIDANIWGLRHLLDYYTPSKTLRGFLFFSSSEIYGDPDPAHIPTPEDYRGNVACIGPRACYDESKRFGETLCEVFAQQHGTPIRIARPFNNYGPGMRLGDRRLPADLAKCVIEGRDIALYSNGTPTRTFCYIADAIAGYMLCLMHNEFDSFNIGIETPEITVQQLAELYRKHGQALWDYKGSVRHEVSEDKDYLSHNPQRRCPVIAKAKTKLGYNPQISVDQGVYRYLKFLKETKAG